MLTSTINISLSASILCDQTIQRKIINLAQQVKGRDRVGLDTALLTTEAKYSKKTGQEHILQFKKVFMKDLEDAERKVNRAIIITL